MLNKISIENFRGFKSLQIEDCKRFNLVIGKNNVGKTALLESLFLHVGSKNPELPIKINIFRGILKVPFTVDSLWSPLFNNFSTNKVITVSTVDDKYKSRRLEIKLASAETKKIVNHTDKKKKDSESSLVTSTSLQDRIELKYYNVENDYSSSYAIIGEEGITFENLKNSDLTGIFVLSRGKGGGMEDSERYAKLDVKGETYDVVEILKKVEPRLRRLSVVPHGPNSSIYGDIGIGQSIPIQLMGEGTSKLLSLALAITAVPNGIVLIDEIENGLHYSIMEEVFKAIIELANKYNVQIFATTHSNECLNAFFNSFFAIKNNDLSVIRLDRINDEIKSVVYNKESLETVIETGWEIRG